MSQDYSEKREGFAAAAVVGLLVGGSKLNPADLATEAFNIGEAMAQESMNREQQKA